ncbi:GAF domain-containing protein [Nocardiopsis sp. RSe5-2]|uniref:GAF domain-containing protein n=1 Tax=Nocardiopsis endophytica TaxID=3018445 RepID=A0ABT4U8K5_9ACTN|nr:GAF domain-containing protein [Nocardiopsis endophytica]MDA2813051.1 GAF domain-containing protein [Nocardiopsis endophytica]
MNRPAAPLPGPVGGEGPQTWFLRLLLRDAPAVEYERPLMDARAAGWDPERLAELETTKVLALEVRSVLADRRRRESELAALYETASDLAGMRDLDRVLHAIVDRARNLLGTDTAYLTLRDQERDDGGTSMRVTSGSVSARFQRLRLSPGDGLGGLVAQTALPYVTANYLNDARFLHTDDIDAGVREEGLVAILGVPLQLNGRVIGVLFAANRRERPFSHEEVALLGSLAAHASIAIDNAGLLEDTRAALEELGEVNQRLTEHSAGVERAAAAHERFTDLVLRGGGVEDVEAAVSEVLGGRAHLVGEPPPVAGAGRAAIEGAGAGAEDAADGGGDESGTDLRAVEEAVRAARAGGRVVQGERVCAAPVMAGGEPLGTLVLEGVRLDAADLRILERAAMVIALLLVVRRSASEAEHRVRTALLDALLDGPGTDGADGAWADTLRHRAARLGVDLDAPYEAVAAEAPGAHAGRLASAALHLAETGGGLAGARGPVTVLVLPHGEGAAAAKALSAAVNAQVTAGVAGTRPGPAGVREAFAEARRCLRALTALGRAGEVARPEDLGFLGLLLGGDRDVRGFVEATLGPVLAYDAEKGTALTETLRAYFAHGASPAKAKDALHVHVNTVTQRLERVGRLLGRDWQSPQRALEIQTALRLHTLLHGGVDLEGGPGQDGW